jgi:WD40 repeat protein
LIDIWNVGESVSSVATLSLEEGGFVMAAGTDSGKVVIRQDWEEFIPRQHECGQKSIIDVKFSKNGQLIAAASIDKNIYLLKYSEGEYHALAACKLENGFPVSLNFSEDSQRIVITTNQRKLLVLDPQNFMLMYKPEDLSSCFWSSWLSKFALITKSTTT